MLPVKAHYRGDIRRFTLNEEQVELNELKHTLKKLYKISSKIELSAKMELGQNIPLRSTIDLQKVAQQNKNSTLRIYVNIVEDKPISSESAIRQVMESPAFKNDLEEIVLKTIRSESFIDSIVKQITPIIQQRLIEKEEQVIVKNSEIRDEIAQNNLEKKAIDSVSQKLKAEKPQEEKERKEEKKEDEKKDKEIKEKEKEEGKEENDEEDPEPFVFVNSSDERPKFPIPLLQSFISFLKGKPSQPREENDEPIPNLEELLKQLEEMGFTDRESNTKTLKFHKKFKEGIDEVVEDLLTQSSIEAEQNPNRKEIPNEIESKPEE